MKEGRKDDETIKTRLRKLGLAWNCSGLHQCWLKTEIREQNLALYKKQNALIVTERSHCLVKFVKMNVFKTDARDHSPSGLDLEWNLLIPFQVSVHQLGHGRLSKYELVSFLGRLPQQVQESSPLPLLQLARRPLSPRELTVPLKRPTPSSTGLRLTQGQKKRGRGREEETTFWIPGGTLKAVQTLTKSKVYKLNF